MSASPSFRGASSGRSSDSLHNRRTTSRGPSRQLPAGEGWPAGGGLRQALDAVLSSPTEAAPAVDETGAVIGWITRSAVLAAVDGIRDRS